MSDRTPTVLVFDSGLGGLTVFSELRTALAGARFVYAADDAVFPYGRLPEDAVIARVTAVMDRLIPLYRPDVVVIACNTASTLVLPALRSRFSTPFVGTVPAIKPAVAQTRTGRVAILATPGTVRRDYTRALVQSFAAGIAVELVGAVGLAALAERHLKGEAVDPAAVLAEISPCFVDTGGRRTDIVVLACTHYPLVLDLMRQVAPWPVAWLDPAPAIARRTADLLGPLPPSAEPEEALAIFTSGAGVTDALRKALLARGLPRLGVETMGALVH
ncbi:glutamate racemase [Labrys monachus]|uniref:Glutamate racemase n=1 Tax=Labrys monachus TaxID=217067 RepID=A0ABU0FHF7_9HYPH|nr:glutamate racemase [Labrys monachus]MDQ0394039.1 glutamate racemase [Labrys monachus]